MHKRTQIGIIVLVFMLAMGAASAAITDGLKVYYPFNQSGGSGSIDYIRGITTNWTNIQSLTANGAYIRDSNMSIIYPMNPVNATSICIYANQSINSNTMYLFGSSVTGGQAGLVSATTGTWYERIGAVNNNTYSNVVGYPAMHYYCIIHNLTTNDVNTFYVDGTVRSKGNIMSYPGLFNASNITIGALWHFSLGKLYPWNGTIQNLAIWNRVLSDAEVNDLYLAGGSIANVVSSINLTIYSQSYALQLLIFNATATNGTIFNGAATNGQVVMPFNGSIFNVTVFSQNNNTFINQTFLNVPGNGTLIFNYSVINVSAKVLFPLTNISNFTTRLIEAIQEISVQNVTASNVSVLYTQNGNYTLYFDSPGYISKAYNITLGDGVTNFQVNTSPDNAVSLLFLDEITSVAQSGITFDIINDAFSRRVVMGANTSILLQSIPYGDYEFRYGLNNASVQPRSYYISFPITTSNLTNITLRTINATVSTLFIRNIVDATSQPMTGYVLDVQRFYTNGTGSTGAWETVAQAEIDQRGDAVFAAIPNTQAYRFRILSGTELVDTFTPSYLVDQSSNFISKGTGGVLANFNTAQGIGYTPIRNTSSQLVFDYSSTSEIGRICMDVIYEYRFNSSRVQACSNANSGTLASSIDPTQNGTYTATVYANVSGDIYTLDTIKFKPTGTDPRVTFGKYGLIIWLVSMLVAGIIGGFVNPIPGLIFAVTATLAYAASFIGLISMSVTIAGGLLITVIIVLILFARRE